MNSPSFSEFEFEKNIFKKLNIAVTESKQRISYIAEGGINKSEIYQKAIMKFQAELKEGLEDNDSFTWKEILYITNEIATDKSVFNTVIKYNEFDTFILLVKEYKKITIYKKLFTIFFKYYSTLSNEGAITVLKMNLKAILRTYAGRNKYLLNLINKKDYIFGAISDLLENYNYDFEKIKFDFHLQDDFEFLKVILNLKIIQELKLLNYDEDNEELFSNIISKKEIFFDAGITLKGYVADYLIGIAMSANRPFPNWQIFILKLLGDPRSIAMFTSESRTWDTLGEDKKNFFIKTLSKDDLKMFLEVLADSVSDTNYHYRKAFWMQFIDRVIFTKIIIGKNAYISLSNELKNKFKLNNDSYGRLHGTGSQSAIYIDFGAIKIIEFTHNGQVKGFRSCPIDIHKKYYFGSDLGPELKIKLKELFIFSVTHSSPKTYNWQNKLLKYLNHYLKTSITQSDIEIPKDRNKVNNYLHNIKKQTGPSYPIYNEDKKKKEVYINPASTVKKAAKTAAFEAQRKRTVKTIKKKHLPSEEPCLETQKTIEAIRAREKIVKVAQAIKKKQLPPEKLEQQLDSSIHLNDDITEPYKKKYRTCKKCAKTKQFNEFSLIGNGVYNPYCNDCLVDQEDTPKKESTNKSILSMINATINRFK